ELVKLAAFVLTLRGLLTIDATHLRAASASAGDRVDPAIEKAVLKACLNRSIPAVVTAHNGGISPPTAYQLGLQTLRLLADDEVRVARREPVLFVGLLVCGLTVAKITVALNTGHSNVGFLIILTTIAGILILSLMRKRLTGSGESALADLRNLFSSLR